MTVYQLIRTDPITNILANAKLCGLIYVLIGTIRTVAFGTEAPDPEGCDLLGEFVGAMFRAVRLEEEEE